MEHNSVSSLSSHDQPGSQAQGFGDESANRPNYSNTFVREDVVVDELAHLPPFNQTLHRHRGGSYTLRDAVIRRQSTRTFPTEDMLLQRMEDQLVRWSPPQSSFKVDDILNNRHAYQRTNMPMFEALSSTTTSQAIAESDFEGPVSTRRLQCTHDELTTPAVEPSVKPYRDSQRLSTIEEDSLIEGTPGQADQLARSPSISSSMLQRLKSAKLQDSAQNAMEQSPLTIDAFPIDYEDIRGLVKDQPTALQDMIAQPCSDQAANEELASQPLFCDELSLICSEMWLDCWACLSCNCQSIDEDTRALYLSHRQH